VANAEKERIILSEIFFRKKETKKHTLSQTIIISNNYDIKEFSEIGNCSYYNISPKNNRSKSFSKVLCQKNPK